MKVEAAIICMACDELFERPEADRRCPVCGSTLVAPVRGWITSFMAAALMAGDQADLVVDIAAAAGM
jgi:DNA-directed RNA polymerase subunit RPC12/RpoP